MPRIKKATDANGTVFYPVTISEAVWDTDNNKRLAATIADKADKTAVVSTVEYDTTNKKITKTINGTTTDVVAVSTIKTDLSLTKSDVGLGNVGNFKAVSTSASQGLSSTEQSNARANIGAGTSNFSGSYDDLSNKPTIPSAAANGTFSIKTKVGDASAVTAADFTANQSSADDVTFIQGSNVTLTTDATNRTITVAASNTNTATAADNILDGSNSGTQITYAPYSTQQSKLSFDTSSTAPLRTDRLNLNGYLYATKLYSGGTEVLTSHQSLSGKQDKVGALGSTTKPVYTSASGTFAECSSYAGGTAVTLNGTSKAANTASFYAPTSAGTSGQYLASSGSGEPTWTNFPSSLPASDVSSWAKAASKPSYAYSEIGYETCNATYAGGAVSLDGSIPLHVVTLTGDVSALTLSSNPSDGHSCHVIFVAYSAHTVTIMHDSTSRICPKAADVTLSIPADGYVEVDFLRVGSKIFVRGV